MKNVKLRIISMIFLFIEPLNPKVLSVIIWDGS